MGVFWYDYINGYFGVIIDINEGWNVIKFFVVNEEFFYCDGSMVYYCYVEDFVVFRICFRIFKYIYIICFFEWSIIFEYGIF